MRKSPELPKVEDFDLYRILDMEKEATGLYISGHPFDQYDKEVLRYTTCRISDLPCWKSDRMIPSIGGIIIAFQEKYTKKGDAMGILELEDSDSKAEVVCFPRVWNKIKPMVRIGEVLIVKGSIKEDDGRSIIAKEAFTFDNYVNQTPAMVRLVLPPLLPDPVRFRHFLRDLKGYPGRSQVILEIKDNDNLAMLSLNGIKVDIAAPLEDLLKKYFPGDIAKVLH